MIIDKYDHVPTQKFEFMRTFSHCGARTIIIIEK